jgi:hypothetical protein
MTFSAHDEIRIRRLATGFLTELCKDGVCHTKLFDVIDNAPSPVKTVGKLMDLCEITEVDA